MASTATFLVSLMVIMTFTQDLSLACMEARPPPPDTDFPLIPDIPEVTPQLTPVFDPNNGHVLVGVPTDTDTQ